ncbi:MAG: glycosyltransferase family 39 protein [Holophagae bacterium]
MTGDRHPALLAVWSVVIVVCLTWGIGSYPLIDQDEGRNGEVAREMAATNDYILPHLNGLPYIDKPVLSFAATAAAMELLGPTELAARLVPLLCSLATALLIGWFAGRWYGRESGWIAGIVAITAPLPLAFSRVVILDSLLALLVTASLVAFDTAIERRVVGREDRLWNVLAWAAIGLGILTKGPVALALPLMVAAPYAVWRRASWAVWNPIGPVVAAALVAPWVGFMEARLPGYLRYVAITETWQRVSSDELQRSQPWWYLLAVAAVGFFPWWLLVLGRRGSRAASDPRRIFGWLWLGVPLVFFSLSRSKMPQYILPLMPSIALLVASRWRDPRRTVRLGAWLAVAGWSAVGAAMLAVGVGAIDTSGVNSAVAAALPVPCQVMAVVCLAAVVVGAASIRSGDSRALVIALGLPVVAIPVVLAPAISALAENRSERALVRLIQTELPAETEVLGLEAWRPSLAFYLRRPVPIASRDGDELRSNFIVRTADRWLRDGGVLRPVPDPPTSVARCDQPTVVLVHVRRPDLQTMLADSGLERIWVGPKLAAYVCDPAATVEDAATDATGGK